MTQRTWPPFVCPLHFAPLRTTPDSLVCPRGHRYAVRAGIPRFADASNYADAFGEQWNRFRRTQLDSYTGVKISLDRARRCLGDALWNRLAEVDVLECGCGAGRFTEVLLERDARVTSVDLSTAVEANQLNCPQDGQHRLAAADIAALPFLPRQFDVVFCLGVIQHTPSPEATIVKLYDHVKPGGWLVIDHYARNLSRVTKTAPLFRAYFRRLPATKTLQATERLVDALLPIHRAASVSPLLRAAVTRLSPVAYYAHRYPQLDPELLREWALLDTHDSLTDQYKHLRSRRQIRRTLEALGLEGVECWRGGNGVEARGRRPE